MFEWLDKEVLFFCLLILSFFVGMFYLGIKMDRLKDKNQLLDALIHINKQNAEVKELREQIFWLENKVENQANTMDKLYNEFNELWIDVMIDKVHSSNIEDTTSSEELKQKAKELKDMQEKRKKEQEKQRKADSAPI